MHTGLGRETAAGAGSGREAVRSRAGRAGCLRVTARGVARGAVLAIPQLRREERRPEWRDERAQHGEAAALAELGVDAVNGDDGDHERDDAQAGNEEEDREPPGEPAALDQLPLVPERDPPPPRGQPQVREEARERPEVPDVHRKADERPDTEDEEEPSTQLRRGLVVHESLFSVGRRCGQAVGDAGVPLTGYRSGAHSRIRVSPPTAPRRLASRVRRRAAPPGTRGPATRPARAPARSGSP